MTRCLILADTQIGVSTVDLTDQRAVLDRIVHVALERKVDAVLHGGDVFEGPVVTPEQLRCFVDAVRPLRDAGIPLLVIRGNGRHDMAVRSVHALDILREVDGIKVADSPSVAVLGEGAVAVCTLPWVHPGRLIASMNGGLTHDEADETTAHLLVRIAGHLHAQARMLSLNALGDADALPVVLLAHWAISGSALPTGLPVDEMREPVLSWPDLDALGYDAIIGAHIHQAQQLSQPELDDTLGIVVGSPQPLNHGEGGYDHGCWIVDIEQGVSGNAVSTEFIPIESKQFHTFTVANDAAGLDGLAEGFIGWEVPEGAVVRVRYQATEDDARRIDHVVIRRAYMEKGASRVEIQPQIIRQSRARSQEISEELSAGDALLAYCRAQGIPVEMAGRMLARLNEWGQE